MDGFRTFSLWPRFRRAALGADSAIDAGLYSLWIRAKEAYERFVSFMDRFHVSGVRKGLVDVACETLTFGMLGGLLAYALAMPAIRLSEDPNWLKRTELSVLFLDRYGNEIGRRGSRRDESAGLDEFPEHLIKAVLATEDRRFYEHFGIDAVGTMRAITVNARSSGVVQGGSSITQQLAKNIFLSNERSLERKIKEAFLALWIEARLSKREILQLYLERAYMGGGNFGVQSAADYYFGKSIRDITLAESAMLAGLFKAPAKFAPHVNLPAARARANDVLSNLVEAGLMTESQVFGARQNPATPVERKNTAHPDYFLDWAYEDVRQLAEAGKFGDTRAVIVRTAFDPEIQAKSEAAAEAHLRQFGKQYDAGQAAVVVMDTDGAVRALVGGRDYGASQFNRAANSLRQPGSAFKPYVYATALSTGKFKPSTIVVDRPTCVGNWCPNNYTRAFAGAMPLSVALAKSINTIPVQLTTAIGDGANKTGRVRVVAMARGMGLNTPLADQTSLPLGSAEVTVMDMAAGYAVFANGGRRAKPASAIEVRNSRGDVMYRHDQDARRGGQVLTPQVVADMNFMLSKVVEEGTGRRAALQGIRSAGKTGTTSEYRDAWYVGYTGNLVAAVWFGNDDSSGMNNMTGGTVPAMLWNDIMTFAHRNLDIKPLQGLPEQTPDAKVAAQTPAQRAAGFKPIDQARASALTLRTSRTLLAIEEGFRSQQTGRAAFQPVDSSRRTAVQLINPGLERR